ncbi:hypothetical protein BT69DRAFT_1286153 [Atractiella rhizophila]|nr:hypothetical protein BT69DRAFT_1286153 [Atractiella rhizophila]
MTASTGSKAHDSMLTARKSNKNIALDVADALEGEKAPFLAGDGKEVEVEVESEGLSAREKKAMGLLIVLFGLAFGSVPFLLRARLSYSQIGFFSFCTYPYSLKLLWSPIVDSFFIKSVGRRKSWIIPVQLIVGACLLWASKNVEALIDQETPDVKTITWLFLILVFFAATQDIAVDGWALELLDRPNLSYASTAQTIGLNIGYFLSFTVFLAFNSVEFSNKYFRPSSAPLDYPLLSLPAYLHFWAYGFWIVTAYLAFFQAEAPPHEESDDMDVKKVYSIMYKIIKLKHVQALLLLHFISKLGIAAHEAATSLKFLEKGIKKEDLALAVLIDFPLQIYLGYQVGKQTRGMGSALTPWVWSQWARLVWAGLFMIEILSIPKDGSGNIGLPFFIVIILSTIGSSFVGTVNFVGISAFHTQISDPLIGGTYMTLLNTVSNLGGTWPRYFVLRAIDAVTIATCHVEEKHLFTANVEKNVPAEECFSERGKEQCAAIGGTCVVERDGYYAVSCVCIAIGCALLLFIIQPAAKRLQALPPSAWRVKMHEK